MLEARKGNRPRRKNPKENTMNTSPLDMKLVTSRGVYCVRPDPHPRPDLTRLRARLPVTNTQVTAAHAHCTSTNTPNTPCFTAGGIFMPNSQIRFSGPPSRAPNLPYRGYPERLSTAHTVTI